MERGARLATAAIEVCGLALSMLLVAMHFDWVGQEAVPCPRGSIFACGSILKGAWSAVYGVPWAVLGALYFAGQLALTSLLDRGRAVGWLKGAGLVAGLAVVMGLRGVELVHLRKICPLCWGVAGLTIAQAVAAWPLLPGLARAGLLARTALVGGVALALHGVILTVLLLGVDVRRAPVLAQTVVPTGDGAAIARTDDSTTSAGKAAGGGNNDHAPIDHETTATPRFVRPALTQHPGSPIEGPEVAAIRAAGWTVVANPGLVIEALSKGAPMLVFAFDPLCEECHATMKEALSDAAANQTLPAAFLLAVEESALPPPLTGHVAKVPTLLLVGPGGEILWKHEGRITAADLAKKIETQALP